jgi:hypothetical protein
MTDKPRGRLPREMAEHESCFVFKDEDRRPLYSIFFYRRDPPLPNPLDRMSRDETLRHARAMRELPELRKLKRT